MKVIAKANSGSGEQLRKLLGRVTSAATLYWGVNPPATAQSPVIHCGPSSIGLNQLQRLVEGGVATPRFTPALDVATDWQTSGVGQVWRRLNDHTQGKDIRKFGHKDWATGDYWVMQIPPEVIVDEWRLHVFDGLSIARGKKTAVELLSRVLAPLVRSRRNGWRLQHTDDPPKGAKFYAKMAVEALGYKWGAVDMLQIDLSKLPAGVVENQKRLEASMKKSQVLPFVVLEVNQMPGMDDYTAARYAEAIQKLVGKVDKKPEVL